MAAINWHYRYNENGYNIFGRDRDGFDRHNMDKEGYNRDGLDRDDYDRYGYHSDHLQTRDSYNEYGRDGFKEDGYNFWGYDRTGYNRDDRDIDDYDREGYNENGYNRAGLDQNGRNRYGHYIGNLYVYRFGYEGREDNEDEREGEILSLHNKSGKLVLDFNTDRGENYALTQIPVCNADMPLPSGIAWEVHNLFNKEKKIFMSLYYSLGDTNYEPMTVNSVDLFTEIQRLLNAKLYSIVNTLPDYDIKISILIKTLQKLLARLYDWLVKPRAVWEYLSYCDQNRALFLEAICDYTKIPPIPLPVLKIWDLFLRYIINLCSLNDELFTNIILDYSFSNVVEAYRNVEDHRNSLQRLNRLIDNEGDSCPRGWIERLILCVNDYIRQQELLKSNVSKLFMGTTMHNLVELLIKDLKERDEKKKLSIDEKEEFNLEKVNLFTYINEFKLSEENNRIEGDLETKKRILKNKLYCYIYERLSKIYNISDTFPLRENIDKYVESSIYEEDFNDKGKYEKKYLKYKNKYLNLKKINKLKVK
jgi:hypothetical protein